MLEKKINPLEKDIYLCSLIEKQKIKGYIRLFVFDKGFVSIGYNQKETEIKKYIPSNLKIIRRPTGGKTVIHNNDLCFSIAVNINLISYTQLKKIIHKAIKEYCLLKNKKISIKKQLKNKNDLFCSDVIFPGEIFEKNKKIIGLAFRKTKYYILCQAIVFNNYFNKKDIIEIIKKIYFNFRDGPSNGRFEILD